MQCSCSFIMTEHGFDLVAHVPLAPEDTIMSVYQDTPMPRPVHKNFYATVHSATTIIAVNSVEESSTAGTHQQQNLWTFQQARSWHINYGQAVARKPAHT